MTLDQSRYIQTMLETFKMEDCKPAITPQDQAYHFTDADLPTEKDKHEMQNIPYRNAVGSLIYLTNTRPDITHAVNTAARYMSNPGPKHWQLVKRIFRYLSGTVHLRLTYSQHNNPSDIAYPRQKRSINLHASGHKNLLGLSPSSTNSPLLTKHRLYTKTTRAALQWPKIQYIIRAQNTSCLLYTSPSPRDS